MRVKLYCKCGAYCIGAAAPAAAVEKVREAWLKIHDGPGHGPATAEEARRTRAKSEREHLRGVDREAKGL